MAEAAYNPFFWLFSKLLLLLGISSHYIIEVINPLYDVSKTSTTRFAIYYPHYKDKFVSNLTRKFVCAANCLYFLCDRNNLSAVFFITHNSGTYTAEPSLVTKKRKPLKTFLYLFSRLFSLLSLFFSLTLSKMRSIPSKRLAMSKCATLSKW